jgi:hypothetical protein
MRCVPFLVLAATAGDAPLRASEIARAAHIPAKFLEAIL